MVLLKIVILFIVLTSGILFVNKKLHLSQSTSPLITILGITTILYVLSLVGALRAGTYVLIALLILLGIFSFVSWPHRQTENWQISPALVAWTIVFLFIAIYTLGSLFYQWDEFSYWGDVYKYLVAMNHLPDQASNFFITNYPPFTALFQYFVAIILGGSESSAYFAQMLMSFTAIIAVLPVTKWQSWKKYLVGFAVCAFAGLLINFHYQTLYVDFLLGLLFGAGLSIAASKNYSPDQWIAVILVSISLILTKSLGISLALICMGLFYINFLIRRYGVNSIRGFFRSLFKPLAKPKMLLLIILPLLAFLSWSFHTRQFNDTKVNFSFKDSAPIDSASIFPWEPKDYSIQLIQQDAAARENHLLFEKPLVINISLEGVLRTFTFDAPFRTKMVIHNFVNGITGISFLGTNFTMFGIILALLIISALFSWLIRKGNATQNLLTLNSLLIFAGLILYSLLLIFAFIYYFGPSEGTKAPSMDRYMGSFLLGWMLFMISSIYRQPNTLEIPYLKVSASSAIIAAFLVMAMIILPLGTYLHPAFSPDGRRFEVNQVYKEIKNSLTPNDKIYDVWQVDDDSGLSHYMMKYYLTPLPSNNYGWKLGEKESDEDLYTVQISPEDWLKLLNDQHYTYVVVGSSNPVFWQKYGRIFNIHQSQNVPQLYRVTPDELISVPIQKERATNN